MMGCKPCHFPIEQNHGLTHDMDGDLVDATVYRRLIVTVDIPYNHPTGHCICWLCCESIHGRKEHLDAVYRILRYIKSRQGRVSCYLPTAHFRSQDTAEKG